MNTSQFRNYDLIMSDKNEMYLYLNSSWFWVNKPGGGESRARKKLPEGREWTQLQSLREMAKEATGDDNLGDEEIAPMEYAASHTASQMNRMTQQQLEKLYGQYRNTWHLPALGTLTERK